jgi:hypothetical protein
LAAVAAAMLIARATVYLTDVPPRSVDRVVNRPEFSATRQHQPCSRPWPYRPTCWLPRRQCRQERRIVLDTLHFKKARP